MHKIWSMTINSFSYRVTDETDKTKSTKKKIKKLLLKAGETCSPIHFNKYDANEFMMYLLSLHTKKKSKFTSVCYSSKGYFHLCRMYGFKQDKECMQNVTTLFKDLKRRIAREK